MVFLSPRTPILSKKRESLSSLLIPTTERVDIYSQEVTSSMIDQTTVVVALRKALDMILGVCNNTYVFEEKSKRLVCFNKRPNNYCSNDDAI